MYFFSISGLLHNVLGIRFSFARVWTELRVTLQQFLLGFLLGMIDHHPHNHDRDYVEIIPKCCRKFNRFACILSSMCIRNSGTVAHKFLLTSCSRQATIYVALGPVAQLGERYNRTVEVRSSSLLRSMAAQARGKLAPTCREN